MDSPYQQLDKLIEEYDNIECYIRRDSLLLSGYPKMLVMSIASLFEVNIKKCISDFCDNSISPLDVNYPLIYAISATAQCTVADKIYKKFYTTDSSGNEDLRASKFYNLFGNTFMSDLQANFQEELTNNIDRLDNNIQHLMLLIGSGNRYETDFANISDKRDRLADCTFIKAEKAFLSLKFRRNRVAHDYINGLSDSFVDIRNFYYYAVLYVVALETTLKNLTILPLET